MRNSCLHTLSEICREEIILPESYIVSDVVLGEAWKSGGASTIWTGKRGQEDVCIKVFRQHAAEPQKRIKKVGGTPPGESAISVHISSDILLSRHTVEVYPA